MINENILFLDGKGNFKEEEMTALNMNQLESTADMFAKDLEKQWGHSVRWRKINRPQDNTIALKVKIDMNYEQAFIDLLNQEGVYFKQVAYTPSIVAWRIDVPAKHDMTRIEAFPYLLHIEEMPTITLD